MSAAGESHPAGKHETNDNVASSNTSFCPTSCKRNCGILRSPTMRGVHAASTVATLPEQKTYCLRIIRLSLRLKVCTLATVLWQPYLRMGLDCLDALMPNDLLHSLQLRIPVTATNPICYMCNWTAALTLEKKFQEPHGRDCSSAVTRGW